MALCGRELRERDVRHRVDRAGEERIDLRRRIVEVDHPDGVEVRLPAAPVVRVAVVLALATGGEARGEERARADPLQLVGARVAVGDDAVVVLAELLADRGVRRLERHAHGQLVHLLELRDVDGGQACAPEELVLRIGDAAQRVDDVVGAQRLAIVELDAALEPDRPLLGVVLSRLRGERVGAQLVVAVVAEQRLPPGGEARLVGLGRDRLAVDEVLRPTARDAEAEGAAALGLGGARSPRARSRRCPRGCRRGRRRR